MRCVGASPASTIKPNWGALCQECGGRTGRRGPRRSFDSVLPPSPADRDEKTEAEVWKAYGEWHGRSFNTLLASRHRRQDPVVREAQLAR